MAPQRPKTAPQPLGRPAVFVFPHFSRPGIGLRLGYHCVAAAGDGASNIQHLRLQFFKGDLAVVETLAQLINFVHDGFVVRYVHGGNGLVHCLHAGFDHFHQPVG